MDIFKLINTARKKDASDLHLVVASPPLSRIQGSLQPIDGPSPLSAEEPTTLSSLSKSQGSSPCPFFTFTGMFVFSIRDIAAKESIAALRISLLSLGLCVSTSIKSVMSSIRANTLL